MRWWRSITDRLRRRASEPPAETDDGRDFSRSSRWPQDDSVPPRRRGLPGSTGYLLGDRGGYFG